MWSNKYWGIKDILQVYHFFKIGRLGSEGPLDFKDPSEEVIVRVLYNRSVWRKMDLFLHKTNKLCMKVKYHCGVWWLAAGSSSLLCAITRWSWQWWCCCWLHLSTWLNFTHFQLCCSCPALACSSAATCTSGTQIVSYPTVASCYTGLRFSILKSWLSCASKCW